jgi:hypothetical protein
MVCKLFCVISDPRFRILHLTGPVRMDIPNRLAIPFTHEHNHVRFKHEAGL